jgi:hypothetical protein
MDMLNRAFCLSVCLLCGSATLARPQDCGSGRVKWCAVLDSGAVYPGYTAVNIVYNPDRDEYLAAWVGDVLPILDLDDLWVRVLNADGLPRTAPKLIDGVRVGTSRIGLAYGAGVYLLAYTRENGLALRQIDASTGTGKGEARVIADSGVNPAVAFYSGRNNFLVTYFSSDSESFLQLLNSKGKPVRSPVPLASAAGGGNAYEVNHVAYNEHDQRVVTVGTEVKRSGQGSRPVGLAFDNELDSPEPFVYDERFRITRGVAAADFRSTGSGLVGWSVGSKGYIRTLGSGGEPGGNRRKVGRRTALDVLPIAENLSNQNLVIWAGTQVLITGQEVEAIVGQEVGDDASLIGSSFGISGFYRVGLAHAGAYNTISGETVVIYTRLPFFVEPAVVTALLSRP